jgi:hypothetical protein
MYLNLKIRYYKEEWLTILIIKKTILYCIIFRIKSTFYSHNPILFLKINRKIEIKDDGV